MNDGIKIGRDAKTGKFVSREHIKNNPDTTITETMKALEGKKTSLIKKAISQRYAWFIRQFKVIYLALLLLVPAFSYSQSFWGKYEHVAFLKASDNDQGGSEFYWTITAGNTNKVFIITPCSGELKADTNVYKTFTYSKTYYLTCRATDQGGLYSVDKIKVVLSKLKGVKQIPKATRVL